jgi:choline-phosphate cytidylyltransferase
MTRTSIGAIVGQSENDSSGKMEATPINSDVIESPEPSPRLLVPTSDLASPMGYTTNPPPIGRTVRIFVHGVFDLFHSGIYFIFL